MTSINDISAQIPTWGYNANNLTASVEHAAQVSTIVNYSSTAHKVTAVLASAIGLLSNIPIAILVVAGLSLLYLGACLYSQQTICESAGLIVQNPEQFESLRLTPETGDCEALATDHSAETEQWRKRLLEAAQENIVISGNYCGGNSFVELLNDLEAQLEKKKELKVVVISSPTFLTEPCVEKMKQLREKYPQRFSPIESPDIWHVSPGIKKSTNHTKCMVIDYGKYFILGGSGIKEHFTGTGVADETKEQYLQKNGLPLPLQADSSGGKGIIGWIMSGDLRDMDFVFHSKYGNNSVGRQVYKQMLLLGYRWEQYNKIVKGQTVDAPPAHLGAFDGKPSPISPQDSVTMQLMKTPTPHWALISTTVPAFDTSQKKTQSVAFKVLASGPEQKKSHFGEEILHRINSAKESIAINHMYFHPTEEIMNALMAAANRGVKIKIITCGVHEGCPKSHYAFAPRNKANCAHLVNGVEDKYKNNIEVYEFQQGNRGLHKKAMIIDDHVIAGSSNLGYKSLVTTSDHELNFFAQSKEFAQATMKVFQDDIHRSFKRTDFSLSISETARTHTHRALAFLIG
jgi:HKD family nuclease